MAPDRSGSALVCVSGGVDSTAALLRSTQRFAAVRAVYISTSGVSAPDEAVDACALLGVELFTVDASAVFYKRVVQPARKHYGIGLTPNPCAVCNAEVKLLLPFSMLGSGELLVTGHYADNSGGLLRRGKDPAKDQSYFLSLVPKNILSRCWFPLAEDVKSDVRAEVDVSGLPYLTRESQDLCFQIGGEGMPGDIVDMEGRVVGTHNGLNGYTPGQRKGLGAHGRRVFVVELDVLRNRLVIGDSSDLYREGFTLNNINWLKKPSMSRFDCLVQTRYRKAAVAAGVVVSGGGAVVRFRAPQKVVAPGQVGVLYDGDTVLGGGTIAVYDGR